MSFELFLKANKRYLVLLMICLVSFSLRVWLLDKRWINPDEGAHLMDAVLALDGKIPSVDYDSRQPIYVYAIAGTLKLFGINYVSGRLMPLICSMLVGLLIFLIARELFDEKVALLSATIYWMLPLELMNSVIVKTEPLVTLLVCLSLYAVILFSRSSQAPWLIVAGTFAAMGFYVRQSALIVPLTVFGFLLFFYKGRVPEIAKSLGFFLLGHVGFLLMVLIFYSRFMLIEDLLTSGLTPFEFLVSSAKKLSALFAVSSQPSNSLASQAPNVFVAKYPLYYRYIRQAFHLHLFLLIGLGFSVMTLCRQLLSRNKLRGKDHTISYSLLYVWIFSLFVAYTYFFYARGFYIDYFREFLPPLVIVFSAWLRYSVPALDRDGILERFIVGGLCLSVIFFFILSGYREISRGVYISLSIALFALLYFRRAFEFSTRRLVFVFALLAIMIIILLPLVHAPFKAYFSGKGTWLAIIGVIFIIPWALSGKESRSTLKDYAKFMSLSIALGAFVLSLNYSAKRLNLVYDSVWSPQSLEETSAYLRTNTGVSDTVISGAVIWELQAQRRPFLNISHPLAFEFQISEKEKERLQSAILMRPPEAIILDGYTEKTYFRHLPWLTDFLEAKYELVNTAGPARYPVKVYQLRAGSETNTSYF